VTDVSIIIVNYNTKEHLLKCIESTLRQIKEISYVVFVIDNGSTDGSADEVQRLYPSINLIRNERNNGFARAVNQGLKMALDSQYHLILNSDVVLSDNYLKRLVEFLDNHPQSAIVTGQLLDLDGSLQHSFDNIPTLFSELVGKSILRFFSPKKYCSKRLSNVGVVECSGRDEVKQDELNNRFIEVESVIGAAMLVRQKAIADVGFIDEDYFLFLEETDWCYRMRQKGWLIYFFPDVETYHLQGQTKRLILIPAKIEYLDSLYKFFRKHYSPFVYWLFRVIKPCKIFLGLLSNLIMCLLTLYLVKTFRKAVILYSVIIFWHLTLCSEKMTLKYISQKR
jgi:hypothetical protein